MAEVILVLLMTTMPIQGLLWIGMKWERERNRRILHDIARRTGRQNGRRIK